MYNLTYMYISRDFSLPLAIEIYGQPYFFPGHPYIESTTVISDIYTGIYNYVYIYMYIHNYIYIQGCDIAQACEAILRHKICSI